MLTTTGNLIYVTIDNKVIGLAQSLKVEEKINFTPEWGIGDVLVQEYVPGIYQCSLSMDSVLIKKRAHDMAVNSVTQTGILPSINSSYALIGYLNKNMFTIEVRNDENEVIRKFEKCRYVGGTTVFQKHKVVIHNFNAVCLFNIVGTAKGWY